jgi:hypothetical protein
MFWQHLDEPQHLVLSGSCGLPSRAALVERYASGHWRP